MKKTYIAPKTWVMKMSVKDGLLMDVSGATVEGGNAGWVNERRSSWDIWGNNNIVEVDD